MNDLSTCVGSNNQTVVQCPIMEHKDAKDFITIVHNPADRVNNRFVKIRVPHNNYKAQVWSKKSS